MLRLFQGLAGAFRLRYFRALFFLVLVVLISGTIFYSTVGGRSATDALYHSVVTLSTVGDPTYTPESSLEQGFTIAYIIVGTGLFIGLVGYIAYALVYNPLKPQPPEAPSVLYRDVQISIGQEGSLSSMLDQLIVEQEVVHGQHYVVTDVMELASWDQGKTKWLLLVLQAQSSLK